MREVLLALPVQGGSRVTEHLTALTFVAPVFGCERDELTLRVEEAA